MAQIRTPTAGPASATSMSLDVGLLGLELVDHSLPASEAVRSTEFGRFAEPCETLLVDGSTPSMSGCTRATSVDALWYCRPNAPAICRAA
jgi:hypothetical protein